MGLDPGKSSDPHAARKLVPWPVTAAEWYYLTIKTMKEGEAKLHPNNWNQESSRGQCGINGGPRVTKLSVCLIKVQLKIHSRSLLKPHTI